MIYFWEHAACYGCYSLNVYSIFLGDDNPHAEALLIVTVLKTITPYRASSILKQMRLDNFFADSRMSYPHLVGLCFLASLLHSMALFFIMTGARLGENYQLAEHLTSTLLGTFFAFFVCILMSKAFVENLKKA